MVGVMGGLWGVSPKPMGQAWWRCLVVPVLLRLGVPLGIHALGGMSCVRRVCSFGGRVVCELCVGCGGLAFVVGLWWGFVDVWPVGCPYGMGRCFLSLWMWYDV